MDELEHTLSRIADGPGPAPALPAPPVPAPPVPAPACNGMGRLESALRGAADAGIFAVRFAWELAFLPFELLWWQQHGGQFSGALIESPPP